MLWSEETQGGWAMRFVPFGVMAVIAAGPCVTRACVVCDSQVGHSVRQGIFDGHFLRQALLTAAPFPVFLAIASLIYLRFPVPGGLSMPDLEGKGAEGMEELAPAVGRA